MKAGISKGIMIAAITLFVFCGATRAQEEEEGCTNSTLKGDYAFTVSGQIFIPGATPIQREGVAMTHFYGDGRRWILSCPVRTPRHLQEYRRSTTPGFSTMKRVTTPCMRTAPELSH